MKTTTKHKSEKTTIVQQSYNNRSTMKNKLNKRMEHNNEKQYLNAAMTQQWKQQSYNNQNNNETQEWKTTIIQQSINN